MGRSTAAIALLLASIGHEPQPQFRGGIELVTVDVSVRERGRPVPGLTRDDFEVLDNGSVRRSPASPNRAVIDRAPASLIELAQRFRATLT